MRGVWWLWGFLLVILVAAAALWRTPLNGFFWGVLAPLSHLRDTAGAAQESVLASTTAALADRTALYQENLQLKAMLGRSASVPQVLAGVLERPPQTPYDTLTIDAGTEDGVVDGDWVAASGGAVIGSVRDAAAHTAQVQLLSSPGAQYQGLLTASGTSVPVTLVGQGGGSLSTQVPAGTSVAIGAPVQIPGIAEGIEGSVSAISQKQGESFITLYLQLPANPAQLQYVEVWQQSAQ
jgi:cell shape-determining protein MreC